MYALTIWQIGKMKVYQRGEKDVFDNLVMIICFIGAVKFLIWVFKEHTWHDFIYSKERNSMIRMEELRKSYDGVDDLETMVKMVESNPDVEAYVYCTYSAFAGGENREVKIPVKPNSRMWKLLCEQEKERLYSELGKTKSIFRLPFHD